VRNCTNTNFSGQVQDEGWRRNRRRSRCYIRMLITLLCPFHGITVLIHGNHMAATMQNAASTALTKEVADAHYQETWSRVRFAVPRVVILNMTPEKARKFVADASLDLFLLMATIDMKWLNKIQIRFPKPWSSATRSLVTVMLIRP